MKTYVAFLRGINISGKNKISMGDLKKEFEHLEYTEVSTYLNSGNVIFSSECESVTDIRNNIESMIRNVFGYVVPVYLITQSDLDETLQNAPEWWGHGDKDKYDNLIFILTNDTPREISNMIGPVSEGMELVQVHKKVIFWTFDRKLYQKCNWWKKTASSGIADKLTIRTANTVRKMCK
ncbi:MAG: DUF1697 domain-containing protein [Clostridiales bacterium]|nr:DUF1697 domain-containing protein [Clostridiales bacterium]